MSDKMYNILKWAVVIVLPAASTLYTTLGAIWGLPYSDEIPKTITAIGLFFGTIMMISNVSYNKKQVEQNADK